MSPEGLEPKKRQLRKHPALIGYGGRQHHVKSGKAIRCDEEKVVSNFVDVANLPPGRNLSPGKSVCQTTAVM